MTRNTPSLEHIRIEFACEEGALRRTLGVIEARGQALLEFKAPNLRRIVVEDISATCMGHLNKGLLHAHGIVRFRSAHRLMKAHHQSFVHGIAKLRPVQRYIEHPSLQFSQHRCIIRRSGFWGRAHGNTS